MIMIQVQVVRPVLLVLSAQGPQLLGLGVSGWQHLWSQDQPLWAVLEAVLLGAVMGAVLLGAVMGAVLLGAVMGAVLLGAVLLGVVFQSLEPESSSHSRRQVLLHGQMIKVRYV